MTRKTPLKCKFPLTVLTSSILHLEERCASAGRRDPRRGEEEEEENTRRRALLRAEEETEEKDENINDNLLSLF